MIYLDNAATTPMRKEAFEKMLPYFTEYYGNPSGIYELSVKSAQAMEESRGYIASMLGAGADEIYFTSGGTESDNWALIGTAEMLRDKGNHIITTKIEHHAILNTCRYLEKRGYRVTYLDVDEYGVVRINQLKKSICKDTILISIMTANNEIGTIQPIEEVGMIAAGNGILFHTDAVQAFGHVAIDVNKANIHMLSASGHKFGGPKGIGFLYVRNGINLPPFIHGGGQERKRRAGTGNVPSAVAMGEAARLCKERFSEEFNRTLKLREYAIKRILREIPYSRLNGHRYKRLPGNMNFSFQFVEGEAVLALLDMKGICVSTGSACSTGQKEPSQVLTAIGLNDELMHGTIRITLSELTTKNEIDLVINELKQIIYRQRMMSDEYKEMVNPYSRYARRK